MPRRGCASSAFRRDRHGASRARRSSAAWTCSASDPSRAPGAHLAGCSRCGRARRDSAAGRARLRPSRRPRTMGPVLSGHSPIPQPTPAARVGSRRWASGSSRPCRGGRLRAASPLGRRRIPGGRGTRVPAGGDPPGAPRSCDERRRRDGDGGPPAAARRGEDAAAGRHAQPGAPVLRHDAVPRRSLRRRTRHDGRRRSRRASRAATARGSPARGPRRRRARA